MCVCVRACVHECLRGCVCLIHTVFSFSKDFMELFFHSSFIPVFVFIS